MSIELIGESATLILGNTAWCVLLNLAQRYGWVPDGTQAPAAVPRPEWSGGYDSSDGQTVSSQDSQALADALIRAAKAPDRSQAVLEIATQIATAVQEAVGWCSWSPSDFANDQFMTSLNELSSFCRLGTFRIE